MQKRIKELYKQASFDDSVQSEEAMVEKFAELIIKECVDVAFKFAPTDESACKISTEIEHHFELKD